MMNGEVKRKWVEALRSGAFQQGQKRLAHTDNTFCCLGVLCELAVREGVCTKSMAEEDPLFWEYDAASKVLPRSVQRWAGLTYVNPDVMYHGDVRFPESKASLATLNDSGVLFSEIADRIEAQL